MANNRADPAGPALIAFPLLGWLGRNNPFQNYRGAFVCLPRSIYMFPQERFDLGHVAFVYGDCDFAVLVKGEISVLRELC